MAKNLKMFDSKGAAAGDYALDEKYLELEKGAQAVHDTVVAILAENRAGTASTKTRSEVRGGGSKPYRQKGTGRARAGSSRSPIWRGGGVIFGPRPRSFAKKVNKKVRKLALKRSFSERVEEDIVKVLDSLELADHKTKAVAQLLSKIKLEGSTLLVVNDFDENGNVLRATRNLAGKAKSRVTCLKASAVNVYQLLNHKNVLFTKDAMDEFVQRLV